MISVTHREGALIHQDRTTLGRLESGFSLVEVMVALVVVSIGLLGLAKMESLALASEDVSGARTIAAMQASSLAAMMHADRGYWGSTSVTASAVVTGGAVGSTYNVTDTTLTYGASPSCTGTSTCTPVQLAANDLYNWGTGLQGLLPGYQATITCTPAVAAAPVTCMITVSWVENAIAANAQQSSMSTLPGPSYTLNVEP
jgi:type IV pilus assembly protein PilV